MPRDTFTLYHIGFSRSTAVLWMLEELGRPYKVRPIPREPEDRDPDYAEINPMGKVPALDHNGMVVTEAAAICLYLAEACPEADLNVPVGDARRGQFLKWLFFAPSCLEPAILDRMFERSQLPPGSAGWGTLERVVEAVSSALSGGPFILGKQFTAADVVLGSQLGWGVMVEKLSPTPEIERYLGHLAERPPRKRALEMDERREWPM